MTKITMVLSGENEVGVPAEVRRRLGVGAGQEIVFVIEDDGTVAVQASEMPEVTPDEVPEWRKQREGRPYPEYTLEETIGSLPMLPDMSDDFDAEIEDAIHEALDLKMERLAKQRQ